MAPGDARRPLFPRRTSPDEILRAGTGVLQASGEEFRYTIRILGLSDVDDLVALQDEILAPLKPPLPLYRRDRTAFEGYVEGAGCALGAFHADRLIAYACISAPGESAENLGISLGLSGRDLLSVARHAGSAVQSEYRRNRLQVELSDVREEIAREAGFEHLCAEIVPGNPITLRSHVAMGYLLKAFRIDHLGDPNYVIDKELQREPPEPRPGEIPETAYDDIDGFRRMVADGMWGFRTVNRGGTLFIGWGRFG